LSKLLKVLDIYCFISCRIQIPAAVIIFSFRVNFTKRIANILPLNNLQFLLIYIYIYIYI